MVDVFYINAIKMIFNLTLLANTTYKWFANVFVKFKRKLKKK